MSDIGPLSEIAAKICRNKDLKSGCGTGFFISEDEIATCYHVLADKGERLERKYYVRHDSFEDWIEAIPIDLECSEELDTALLRSSRQIEARFDFGLNDWDERSVNFTSFGSDFKKEQGGIKASTIRGKICGYAKLAEANNRLQLRTIKGTVYPGRSGSPVWSPDQDAIVGMIDFVGKTLEAEGYEMVLAIPISHIRRDIRVGSQPSDDYSTIREAIDAADPGNRIRINPGTYRESLVIKKRLSIIGSGDPGSINVVAEGAPALHFGSDKGRVANLALKQAGANGNCVDVADGELILENCRISSRKGTCISVSGSANPLIRSNIICDSQGNGVYFKDNCRGILEKNDIHGISRSCVVIENGANPSLRSNRIHDSLASGIHIRTGGRGMIVSNEIYGNALAGVTIEGGSDPFLGENKIHDGKGDGIYVFNKGLGKIEGNEILANIGCGVVAKEGSYLVMHRNKINKNLVYGIAVDDYSGGVFEDNDLGGNRKGAFKIDESPGINRAVSRKIANNSE